MHRLVGVLPYFFFRFDGRALKRGLLLLLLLDRLLLEAEERLLDELRLAELRLEELLLDEDGRLGTAERLEDDERPEDVRDGDDEERVLDDRLLEPGDRIELPDEDRLDRLDGGDELGRLLLLELRDFREFKRF